MSKWLRGVTYALTASTLCATPLTIWLWQSPRLARVPESRAVDYWIAFWSALFAGLILAVPIGIVIAIWLKRWDEASRARNATEDAYREITILLEQLRYELRLPWVRDVQRLDDGDMTYTPKAALQMIDVLRVHSLYLLKDRLAPKPDSVRILDALIAFQTAAREFRVYEKLAVASLIEAFDRSETSADIPSVGTATRSAVYCVAYALGYEVARGIRDTNEGYPKLYAYVCMFDFITAAFEKVRQADVVLEESIKALIVLLQPNIDAGHFGFPWKSNSMIDTRTITTATGIKQKINPR